MCLVLTKVTGKLYSLVVKPHELGTLPGQVGVPGASFSDCACFINARPPSPPIPLGAQDIHRAGAQQWLPG